MRIALFVLVAIAFAAAAQPAAKMARVGFIASTSPVSELVSFNPAARSFARGMNELGYIEGQNLVLEWRSALGDLERTGEIVQELIALKVQVIVTVTNPMTDSARRVSAKVPIVMASSTAPVEAGLVKSLARPGGNVTGLTLDAGPEIFGKRLQLLRELLPSSARVAVIGLASGLEGWSRPQAEAAARSTGARLLFLDPPAKEYAAAFAQLARDRVDTILVAQSAINYGNRRQIAELASKARLPVMYPARDYVLDADGLISYGADISEVFRRAAGYVDRILKGANPADMPIERPTKFELVINLKAAKALGLVIPPSVMLQADQIVQ